MTALTSVESFLAQKRLAVVGVSQSGKGFGVEAFKILGKKGYDLVPIHPTASSINGTQAYPSLAQLPEPVGGVLVVVPPEQTEKVVEQAAEAGIQHLWMQQGSASEKAIKYCKEKGIDVVHGECILMFADPGSFPHNVHRWIWGAIGKLPKN